MVKKGQNLKQVEEGVDLGILRSANDVWIWLMLGELKTTVGRSRSLLDCWYKYFMPDRRVVTNFAKSDSGPDQEKKLSRFEERFSQWLLSEEYRLAATFTSDDALR